MRLHAKGAGQRRLASAQDSLSGSRHPADAPGRCGERADLQRRTSSRFSSNPAEVPSPANSNAPMSLVTYQEARPWARAIKQRDHRAQMPPWHIDRTIGEYSPTRRSQRNEIDDDREVDRRRRAARARRRCAAAEASSRRAGTGTYGEPDFIVRMEKGFKIPAQRPRLHSGRNRRSRSSTEDRYVKWVQIIPDAPRVRAPRRTSSSSMPEGTDRGRDTMPPRTGLQRGDAMDLIEYGAGNDADIFPDGTTKVLKKGSHASASRATTTRTAKRLFDRMRVGIKFYPKGVVPKYVVTSHRIRTGWATTGR